MYHSAATHTTTAPANMPPAIFNASSIPFFPGRHEPSDFPNRKIPNNFILRISIFQPEAPCYKLFFQNCFHSTFFSLLSAFHDKNSHETPPSLFYSSGKTKIIDGESANK
jgi:hypothetical protein